MGELPVSYRYVSASPADTGLATKAKLPPQASTASTVHAWLKIVGLLSIIDSLLLCWQRAVLVQFAVTNQMSGLSLGATSGFASALAKPVAPGE
jgi:hypothetical protein